MIEGTGSTAIVMIHGWPDTYRLWDAQVVALKAHYICVRFTLPGFDDNSSRRAYSLTEIVEKLRQVVCEVSPQKPVILLLHDWGCLFGYQFAAQYPEKVARIIGLDLGDTSSDAFMRSLSPKAKLMIFTYQIWLAAAWKIGGTIGDRMTRTLARVFQAPGHPTRISAAMNYPYYIQWTGAHGSYRHAQPFAPRPEIPLLYAYGRNKPVMFHSPDWLDAIAACKGSQVTAFDTGHWIMHEQPDQLNRTILGWLSSAS